MKKTVILMAGLLVIGLSGSLAFAGQHIVRGHYRDTNGDGIKDTYVAPYVRTSPNSTTTDNYSYPGNYNPNTGKYTPQNTRTQGLYPVANPSYYGNSSGSGND